MEEENIEKEKKHYRLTMGFDNGLSHAEVIYERCSNISICIACIDVAQLLMLLIYLLLHRCHIVLPTDIDFVPFWISTKFNNFIKIGCLEEGNI